MLRRIVFVAVTAAAGLYGQGGVISFTWAQAGAAPRPSACGWSVMAVPSGGGDQSQLTDVAAFSSTDAWAVGRADRAGGLKTRGLLVHWDGSSWTAVALPELSHAILNGVAGSAPNDVWAVGTGRSFSKTLTLHFDGSSWSRVPSPTPGTTSNLEHVFALASDDAWAVGESYHTSGGTTNLALHWDGARWRAVGVPSIGTGDNRLHGILAISPTDAWAVGQHIVGARSVFDIYHWDGTSWTESSAPHQPGIQILAAVSGVTASSVWAVGVNPNVHSLVLHWDGSSWTELAAPTGQIALDGVSATASDEALAVGIQQHPAFYEPVADALTASSVTREATPAPGSFYNALLGVSALAGGEAWAVGIQSNGTPNRPLAEHRTCP